MATKTPVTLDHKTVLVTGSPGFIGANLVLRLLREMQGGTVISLDNMNDYYDPALKEHRLALIEKAAESSSASHVFVRGSIADKALIEQVFEQYQPAVVVNLAAQAGVLAGRFAAAFFFAILMARLCETRWSLALPILVHFLYDFVLFAPLAWSQGIMRANVLAGGVSDAISVAIQAVCLAVVVLECARRDSCYHTRSES